MAYCTEEDILKAIKKREYDKLVAPDTEEGSPTSEDILTAAIQEADEMIDSYLRSTKVTLPFETVPKLVTGCSVDIAVFILHKRIQYADIPEFWKDAYDTRIAWLKDISAGRANLPVELAEAEQADSVKTYYEPPQMGRNIY